ncbi:MAG: hypothetical protein JSW71_16805 [Gemmatimonadota bacterium]|nr:MAG: hypothetical protein JSW71_16805 [Gemmatimonadota bacterium]
MSIAPVQDLRRIAEAVGQLHGCTVADVQVRSDCRLMRITFTEGRILLVSVMLDDGGKPRLDVDFLRAPEAVAPGQLEVPFDVLPE